MSASALFASSWRPAPLTELAEVGQHALEHLNAAHGRVIPADRRGVAEALEVTMCNIV